MTDLTKWQCYQAWKTSLSPTEREGIIKEREMPMAPFELMQEFTYGAPDKEAVTRIVIDAIISYDHGDVLFERLHEDLGYVPEKPNWVKIYYHAFLEARGRELEREISQEQGSWVERVSQGSPETPAQMKDHSPNCLQWQQQLTQEEWDGIVSRPLGYGLTYDGLVKAMSQGAGKDRAQAEIIIRNAIERYAPADLLFTALNMEVGLQPDPDRLEYLKGHYHGFLGHRAGITGQVEQKKPQAPNRPNRTDASWVARAVHRLASDEGRGPPARF